ncbi:MAG: AAA family ATPase, partial [Eggerthellaceae bacterium]|nr:AAA family ATPase [Eggerthellaceae bacterium]
MHLKSLILKGFKSFADRAVLQMEPGITAIVGPNGSGKSNISDAVLWVLGERNARNLRGQAMEDIIFSGSAARHAVSIAEVELVLDNSDGTLPVDFDEVSIARRMYRNGESEYLINGVISRRMDVLDILHDTGLGTGTHSIISQGSLDTILQSRPEDRRALIEEAAGVLKHKQRKEKSARKLERMDNHLARVRDVVAEIERQLSPLERKAKRAEAYKVASAELAELKLALAVDDLRRLQELWESICSSEQVLSEEVGELRASVDAAEQRSIDLQSLIRQASEDAGALTRQQRRAESIAERLEGVEMVIGERRRTVRGYEADAQATLAGQAERKQAAARELELASEQLAAVEAEAQAANETLGRMETERETAATAMREAQSELDRLGREMRSLETLLDEARHKKAELQEDVSSSIAHGRLIDARKAELTSDLERAQAEY